METIITPERPRPASLTDLFLSFTWLALQGFGGVLAIVQHELVERKRWMTQDEFLEDWAVAQIMPGPNVANLSLMVGGRYFGLPGALAALGGMLAFPLVLLLLLALVYAHFSTHPALAGALRGMAAVSAGLIAASGLKLAATLKRHPLPLPWTAGICLAGIVLVAFMQVPLLYVLAGLGGLGWLLTYRKLGQ
ncbi:MAG TPA: chromate transporter [Janthinobacterium sp.]|jgi:chromate transporter|nr:chromate transporter [Janthinobacterium sp.]